MLSKETFFGSLYLPNGSFPPLLLLLHSFGFQTGDIYRLVLVATYVAPFVRVVVMVKGELLLCVHVSIGLGHLPLVERTETFIWCSLG